MKKVKPQPRAKTTQNSNSYDERYSKLLQEQNNKLQERIIELESEIRSLRDQKELMLVQERKRVEQIYKEKDAQLQQLFTTVASQFALANKHQEPKPSMIIEEPQKITKGIEVKKNPISVKNLQTVKKFIKNFAKEQKCSLEKIERIKKRFKKYAKEDRRIIEVDGRHYVDTKKYEYSDLLKW